MRTRSSFIKLIKLWGIIPLIGIGVSIVAVDVISSYRDFNLRTDRMRADYIASQKQIIKQEVYRVVNLISYEKSQSEILTKSKIKSRVYEAYTIAQNIYQQNKTAKSKAEIQLMIIDALRPIRFEYGSGYYFATRLDGVEVLFADKPEMEGLNLLDVQDTRGQYVIKDMIEIADQSGEGFYEYYWTKPDTAGNDFKKISFIKRFEPYNWFVGTGLYVDDVEEQIKSSLLSTISRIRFGKEGYIFVNRLNGDALVSNGKLISGTKKLWEVFNKNPEKMKDVFDKEYNAALKSEGDYIYYSLIKLTTSNKESLKVSFIYGILDLQWLVGAGVYLDDVETDIALMQSKLNNQIKEKMLYFILIVMGLVALFLLFFNWLNRGLKNDFNLFVSFFNRTLHSDEKIDRETIKFIELDQMAEYANKMLTDRKQAEEALRESEEKLARSKKMESLGLLAGGVAHDLNNVLSGIVSYPELILMDLPDDSKLRKPIETIQDSGHRAAAIVQDLLTVARGVAITKEPLNINDLVGKYLNSPEFNKLKQYHPTVALEITLDSDLLNIRGSDAHIRKALMNLVSNASEAIEGNGNVAISTMNRYVDRPLKGYAYVNNGEYAVLAVSDDGSGISSDDLERIFDPFYTKKVMGRSGTGLGLAVVWNVVQDHDGYIGVKSDENGTTFELYFPITREEISDKPLSISIKDYKGNGETILVVDDMENQIEISCKMLETLGYQTKSVPSGEEAVEYLKEHTVDLILLDMIMEPGMDGMETYRRILEILPKQKAVIVSGFSESERVSSAQALGAGAYVRKPYVMEKLGIAVRKELERES